MKLNILATMIALVSVSAMANNFTALDLGFEANADQIQTLLDAAGPRAVVEANTPEGLKAGFFQVMVSDDQASLVSVVMQKNGDAAPTVLSATQIMASTEASPLVLLTNPATGTLITLHKDAALSASAGGKIYLKGQKVGQFSNIGTIELQKNGGAWVMTGNGRPFTKIALKVTLMGVESFEFK